MKKILLSITCAIVLLMGVFVPATLTKADTDFRYVNNTVKDTYRLDTGIIGYATVTAFINDSADLNAIKGLRYDADKAPAMVFLYTKSVDGNLKITSKSGEVLTSITDVLNNYTRNKVIPAFYLTAGDTETALNLQAYILKHNIKDAFIVSSDADTLTACTNYYNTAGALSRIRPASMLEFTDCKNLSWRQINETCSHAGARACLIDYNDKTTAEFNEFYSRPYAMTAYIKTDSVKEMQSAVLGGAWAVVYDDWKQTIEFIESFDDPTLVHDIIIQGHRGADVYYQENTLEGILVAAQGGYSSIEVDPRLTKDKQIVLMHDADVTRVTGGLSGYVKDYTLEQLKAMSVIANSSAEPAPICTLEEVLIAFEKYGFDARLALDAKETQDEYYQILYDLIEKHDAWDAIASVGVCESEDFKIAKGLFNEIISFETVGAKTVECKENWQASIINWNEVLCSASRAYGAVAPWYEQIIKSASSSAQPEVIRAANDRAIKVNPYQFDTIEHLEEVFYLQINVISSGMGIYLSDLTENFVVDTTSINVVKGSNVNLNGTTFTVNGKSAKATATSYKVIDGDQSVIKQNGEKFVAVNDGTVTVLPGVSYKKGNIEYNVYSDPVTITVTGATANGSGCSSSLASISALSIVVFGISTLIIILKRIGDKN